ncbi:hypothetical protein EON63_07060 [archaeon]|nr:MAG: hypothetical protein EON63_07060 [archaeon]
MPLPLVSFVLHLLPMDSLCMCNTDGSMCRSVMYYFAYYSCNSSITHLYLSFVSIQGFSAVPAGIMLLFSVYLPESPKWLLAQHYLISSSNNSNNFTNKANSTSDPAPSLRDTESQHPSQSNPLSFLLNIYTPVYETSTSSPMFSTQAKTVYYQAAFGVLRKLRPVTVTTSDIEKEMQGILESIQKDATSSSHTNVTWGEVFEHKRGMLIGSALMLFYSITGINSVAFYSTTVFSLAGFDQSIIGTILVGLVQVALAVFVSNIIDKVGRKVLLLSGLYIM